MLPGFGLPVTGGKDPLHRIFRRRDISESLLPESSGRSTFSENVGRNVSEIRGLSLLDFARGHEIFPCPDIHGVGLV